MIEHLSKHFYWIDDNPFDIRFFLANTVAETKRIIDEKEIESSISFSR